jgi:Mce-associated membrane protein
MRWPMFRRGAGPTATEAVDDDSAASSPTGESDEVERPRSARRIGWSRLAAYVLLPGLALIVASGAGYLKWQGGALREEQATQPQTVQAAVEGTIALLSYRSETVDKDLEAAKSRLTGAFLDSYSTLTRDVVIPGAKQKQISATATVSAAAQTSATATHASVLLFVNQSVVIGKTAPTNTASSVRVTVDKIDGRWLISQFDPV